MSPILVRQSDYRHTFDLDRARGVSREKMYILHFRDISHMDCCEEVEL